MVPRTPVSEPPAGLPTGLSVRRLSAAFVVDIANLSRAGGDFLEPLVYAAIVATNQAMLNADPAVRERYGDSGEAIPDELRRPISVAAVAGSLQLSYETTRRRVQHLAARGLCVMGPEGCYVPRAVIVSEAHASLQRVRMGRLVRLHDDLAACGFFAPGEAWTQPPADALARPVNRALSHYMLRAVDRLVSLTGSVLDGFVLAGMSAYASERGMEEAGPMSALALAGFLGIADETVRRRLKSLADAGFARKAARGWRLQPRRVHELRLADLSEQNEADLRRLFARVKQLAG